MHPILLTAVLSLAPLCALADQSHTMTHDNSSGEMSHDGEQAHSDHSSMMEMHHGNALITEPGQGAFAAIGEIVAALEADPETDWTKVDITALRAHLRDMALVTVSGDVTQEKVSGGLKFTITGAANVAPSIQRMVIAHSAVMQGVNDWHYDAAEIPDGAIVTVTVPASDTTKLYALGFFGMLTAGMHHQTHHWMIATGDDPHN